MEIGTLVLHVNVRRSRQSHIKIIVFLCVSFSLESLFVKQVAYLIK
jgi:hypothetical protein